MRIGVDLDGVCYEWERTARYLLNTHRGYELRESTCWSTIPDTVEKADWHWLWSEGVKLGLFRYGHLVRGAIDGTAELVEDGHDLVVITHRPAAAVIDTEAWLNYVGIPFGEMHILTNGEPKSTVDAEVLIDDRTDNVREWVAAGRTGAVLFGRRWNRDHVIHRPIYRASDWPHVVRLVRGLNGNKG